MRHRDSEMHARFQSARRRAGRRAIEGVLLVVGISLLGWSGFTVADAWWFQRDAVRWLDGIVERGLDREHALETTRRRGVLGRLEIPRLALSTVVIDDARESSLRRAAGRIEGSALPGFEGNVAIAGHRDTHFRQLRTVREGDEIRVVTAYGEFRYEVVDTTIVTPDRTDLVQNGETNELTLVTCYPFRYVGKSPLRFIVRAREVGRTFFS